MQLISVVYPAEHALDALPDTPEQELEAVVHLEGPALFALDFELEIGNTLGVMLPVLAAMALCLVTFSFAKEFIEFL